MSSMSNKVVRRVFGYGAVVDYIDDMYRDGFESILHVTPTGEGMYVTSRPIPCIELVTSDYQGWHSTRFKREFPMCLGVINMLTRLYGVNNEGYSSSPKLIGMIKHK